MAGLTISKKKLGKNIPWFVAAIFTIFGLFSTNPELTLASLLLLIVFLKLFWRPGEPPVLLYMMGYQWLQASILIFYADTQDLTVEAVDKSQWVGQSTWLSFYGLLVLAIGLRLGAGASKAPVLQPMVASVASKLSVRSLFTASLLAILFAGFMSGIAFVVRGLSQPIIALSQLHWVVVYIFAYTVMSQHKGYGSLAIIFGIEILIGFLGFFSEFKTILMIFLLAILAAPHALRGVRLQTALAVCSIILVLGVVWTAIKNDYREFLNQGSGEQIVLVSPDERIDKLAELIGNLDSERISDSAELLMDRLTYVHYFGEAIQSVPDRIPFERGKLWGEAIQNMLAPRILYPNKPVIDDSVRTAYYTGKFVAGSADGTSISLGYIAESYIDFGPYWMAFPIFLWGLFIGWVFKVLVRSTPYPLLGYASAAVLISIGASVLEQSNSKMLGGMVMGFVLFYFALKIGGRKMLALLTREKRPRPES